MVPVCNVAKETLSVEAVIFILLNGTVGIFNSFAPFSDAYLAHFFTQALVQKKQPIRGISTLLAALAKIQLHPGQLTSIHADICQVNVQNSSQKLFDGRLGLQACAYLV